MASVILFNKPYGVHSQFRKEFATMATLADFFDDKSLRVAGRLDKDSEGLLILTNHGGLNHAITTPPNAKNTNQRSQKHSKTYLVQVENLPTDEQLQLLRRGVLLKDGMTLPAKVEHILEQDLPIKLWERNPPIRQRANIPTAWLKISIMEGRNRQVRRMVATVGLPCLRLIRSQVGDWTLANLAVGESCRLYLSDEQLLALGVNPCDDKRHIGQKKSASYQDKTTRQSKAYTNKSSTTPQKRQGSRVIRYKKSNAKM